ncbi:MAG: SUMF1/EgtB/PvdO family nonheme iron enzyme [Flavobacteriales bacterium]
MKHYLFSRFAVITVALSLLIGCQKETSTITGWEYNNVENGGFEKTDFDEQRTGPGLVMIEGGTFIMGGGEQDVMGDNNSCASHVSVESFYMDRTEISNFHWLEYVYWMKRVYYRTYPHIYKKALPDTLVWRTPLASMEKFVDYYFRHPGYRNYPVVGVSWLQANDFCKWRTDRVNEFILVEQGILNWHYKDKDGDLGALGVNASAKDKKNLKNAPENMFNTESYLAGQYNVESGNKKDGDGNYTQYTLSDGNPTKVKPGEPPTPRDPYMLNDYDPLYAEVDADGNAFQGKRMVRMEDGILLPKYRLPTEAEWEYAAGGLIGNLDPNSENISSRRIYPWDGNYVRQPEEQFAGTFQANFVRAKGDGMGVAGHLNDGALFTAQVDEYWPNDFGLYNMAGNVSEWVQDTYRPKSCEVFEEFMPFRGNKYQKMLMVPNGLHDKAVKNTTNLYDVYGMKEFVNEYARVLYLDATGKTLDVNSSYSKNWNNQVKANQSSGGGNKLSIDATPTGSYKLENGILTILAGDTLKIKGQNVVKGNGVLSWKLPPSGRVVDKGKLSDTSLRIIFDQPGTYDLVFVQGKETAELKGTLKVVNNKMDLEGFVNTSASTAKINSTQNAKKFQFDAPSQSYVANNRNFSKGDSVRFAMLDDINAYLDTAIYLYNQGYDVKASAFVEYVLFNNAQLNIVYKSDFRQNADKTLDKDEQVGKDGNTTWPIGKPLFGKNFDKDDDYPGIDKGFAIFSDDYLIYRLRNYKTDPAISSWVIELRDGLSEFTLESRGKQRWVDVTTAENKDRLNYRKADYIDYLDGDVESSIYYNNSMRKDEINQGVRDGDNVMYQSTHENYDLNNNIINLDNSGNPVTLISDESKVYKGGSWKDRAFWLAIQNRRFLNQDQSSCTIGFRCAMDRLGSMENLNYKKPKRR